MMIRLDLLSGLSTGIPDWAQASRSGNDGARHQVQKSRRKLLQFSLPRAANQIGMPQPAALAGAVEKLQGVGGFE